MFKSHVAAALLSLATLAALPACSMFPANREVTTAAPASSAQPVVASSMVQQVQTTLQAQGFYKGSVDGMWGPQTQTAVEAYQKAHGMTASGQLDQPTLASMNMGSQPAASAAPAAAPSNQAAATPPAQPMQTQPMQTQPMQTQPQSNGQPTSAQ